MERTSEAIISVAELSRRLRRSVETASRAQWVEAELGAVNRAGSGHVYLTLKDEREDAMLEAVMYRSNAQRANQFLFAGSRVQVLGQATIWAPRGRMQFVIERLRPAGTGALLEALEQLKQKLIREGLFRPERKRSLPVQAKVVGVVTSAHGAAWHDIRKVALRRGSVRLVLAPAVVQGDAAVASILEALQALSRLEGLDVVIVGRGGGSFEDLMAFNDERVVRAVVAFAKPVVSAVGHETDVSLCDLAADVRAATPSEAAELVVADAELTARQLADVARRLVRAVNTRLMEDRHALARLRARVSDPRFVIADKQQAFDDWAMRLERQARRLTKHCRTQLAAMDRRLAVRHPNAVLSTARRRLEPLQHLLQTRMQRKTASLRGRLTVLAARLDALSPLSVLSRGYAIALTNSGAAVRDAEEAEVGQTVRLVLHRGSLLTRVEAIEK